MFVWCESKDSHTDWVHRINQCLAAVPKNTKEPSTENGLDTLMNATFKLRKRATLSKLINN